MIVPVGQVDCTCEKEKGGEDSDRCPKRCRQCGVRALGRVQPERSDEHLKNSEECSKLLLQGQLCVMSA